MDLIRTFTAEQYARALQSWDWVGLQGKKPAFTSPFGDVFLSDPAGYWYLDLVDGSLTMPWPTADQLTAELDTVEGQDRYLLAGLAWSAEQQGLSATGDKVLGFTVNPALGGQISIANLEVIDFVVSVNLAGQLHRQILALPEGTPISRISLAPESGPGH